MMLQFFLKLFKLRINNCFFGIDSWFQKVTILNWWVKHSSLHLKSFSSVFWNHFIQQAFKHNMHLTFENWPPLSSSLRYSDRSGGPCSTAFISHSSGTKMNVLATRFISWCYNQGLKNTPQSFLWQDRSLLQPNDLLKTPLTWFNLFNYLCHKNGMVKLICYSQILGSRVRYNFSQSLKAICTKSSKPP